MEHEMVIILIVSVSSALFGSIIGAASSLLTSWINKKSEERQHYKGLIMNTAVENWKKVCDMAIVEASNNSRQPVHVEPLADSIIKMSLLADLIMDRKPKHKNIKKILKELDGYNIEVNQYTETHKDRLIKLN